MKEDFLDNNTSKTYIKYLFSTNEKNLLSHKSFIRNILNQIKTYQSYCLIKSQNTKELKSLITEIKSKLLSINKEKIIIKELLENQIISNISKLQNEIFGYSKQEKNNISIRNDNLKYLNEKKQLDDLSFKLENEIERINFEVLKEVNLILNLKIERLNQETNLEILTKREELKLKAIHIMKKNLNYHQKYLDQLLLEIFENKLKINKKKKQIEHMKRQLNNKKNHIKHFISNSFDGKNDVINKNENEIGKEFLLKFEDIKEYNKKILRNLSNNIRENKSNSQLNFYFNFNIKNPNFIKSCCKSYKNNKKQNSNFFNDINMF